MAAEQENFERSEIAREKLTKLAEGLKTVCCPHPFKTLFTALTSHSASVLHNKTLQCAMGSWTAP